MKKNSKIHKIGKYKGTEQELANIMKITKGNMVRRINKWKAGKYTTEQCVTIGPLSTKKPEECGNSEWGSLSNKIKDARLSLSNIR